LKFNYYSEDFRKLRLNVFQRDGEKCAKCGAIPKPGTSLTVDHIKPVSKYPNLAMDEDNLQILCWDCNTKKSNLHNTDYRGK
jgi:5-methylcytosine-specific restriction endonuclease McrA